MASDEEAPVEVPDEVEDNLTGTILAEAAPEAVAGDDETRGLLDIQQQAAQLRDNRDAALV